MPVSDSNYLKKKLVNRQNFDLSKIIPNGLPIKREGVNFRYN